MTNEQIKIAESMFGPTWAKMALIPDAYVLGEEQKHFLGLLKKIMLEELKDDNK